MSRLLDSWDLRGLVRWKENLEFGAFAEFG